MDSGLGSGLEGGRTTLRRDWPRRDHVVDRRAAHGDRQARSHDQGDASYGCELANDPRLFRPAVDRETGARMAGSPFPLEKSIHHVNRLRTYGTNCQQKISQSFFGMETKRIIARCQDLLRAHSASPNVPLRPAHCRALREPRLQSFVHRADRATALARVSRGWQPCRSNHAWQTPIDRLRRRPWLTPRDREKRSGWKLSCAAAAEPDAPDRHAPAGVRIGNNNVADNTR